MQIIVTWSNGTKSELEVEVPAGAKALSTSMKHTAPDSYLHQENGRWACWAADGPVLRGYCLPDYMKGRSVVGPDYEEIYRLPGLARMLSITQEQWHRDWELRWQNRNKFHFDGHATEAEAVACYREFLKDFGMKEEGM